MRIVNIFFVLINLYIFSGCANKIALPKIDYNNNIKVLEPIDGYYENKLGKQNKIVISNYELDSKHNLSRWAKNNYKTICFSTKICLIDTLNNGYFSHSAVIGRDELFPLNKPVKYLYTVNHSTIYLPPLNDVSTKEVGESMYEKFNLYDIQTEINQKILDTEFNKKYDLLLWSQNDYKVICEKNICLLDIDKKNIFSHYVIKNESQIFPLDKPFAYKPSSDKVSQDSFKYQALYQGKIGNKIKISFREFSNDMSRPAFTQDIEYELEGNKPTIIGFKGLRIEVIKASNQNITYSVIKDYN